MMRVDIGVSGVIVRVEPQNLDVEALRELVETDGSGCIVSFVGLTRGEADGAEVKRLEFDAWQEKLTSVLHDISTQALDRFSVNFVVIAHRTGVVEPKEPIVCIHVSSKHRDEGFKACSWLISELKVQAPLWKKEVREDGEFWKAGLG
ncbi:MAG: hypothetical protein CND29_02325 [Marine Group II euryarchaeote MED-G36]|jgi:molybdopterin synthase catalytic subunit|nr:MAG: hypothetical protein CND29_02325 [Marine Group II euryarchaeote MED-G36]